MVCEILLADDHLIVREGLKVLLEREGFSVVGEASDGREALQLAQNLRFDVAVLDLSMPLLNGIDAGRAILQACPKAKVILLTMHTEDHQILGALRAGIKGYVLKSKAAEELVQAIQEVSRGKMYLTPGASATVVQAYLTKTDLPSEPLSPRERQLLQLIAEGKTTKEAAEFLGISIKTAESHRTRMMQKLNIHETASLVRYAIRIGLVSP
ncbi:MAG: response regulator transcription factor [Nitrospiraceae bacterium]|jgi:DNA-binding NarL/FixJ family response regulator|nr:response regulator transcription factor [Nitrospiraceae bacterium]